MVVSATLSGVDGFVPNPTFMVAQPRRVLRLFLYFHALLLFPVAVMDRYEDNYMSLRTPG